MKDHTYRRAGFTLVELSVTVTIILMVTLGALVNYYEFDSNQKIMNDVRNLVTFIDKARSKAIGIEYPGNCVGLTAYNVRSLEGGEVEMVAKCSSGSPVSEKERLLSATRTNAPFSIDFLVPSGKISNGENVEIVIEDINSQSLFKTITIDAFLVDKTKIGQ